MVKNKKGCAIITCDRPDFFKKCYNSVKNSNITIIVIDDGEKPIDQSVELENIHHYIKTKGKQGVAIAKNMAFDYFLDNDYEHIFLIEDDIEIIDENVFDVYINTSKATGLKHLNYGLHGNHNRDAYGNPTIIKTVNYGNGISIDLYPNVLGAFSYYHRSVLEHVGLMPTCYFNALEHVDQTYKASLKGYTSPWRYFADVHDSSKSIKDIVPDHQQSKIRNNPNFQENFIKSLDIFIKNNGFSVVQGYGTPEKIISEKECVEKLKEIYKNNV
jgi:GT2 family glycosyltransferase